MSDVEVCDTIGNVEANIHNMKDITPDQKRPSHAVMCGPPYVYMVPAYEYVEYAEFAENSSDTSDTDEDENHNTWNALLEVLTMPGSSSAIQQSLQDWGVCRVALSCHFALHILYMPMKW